MLVCTEVLPKDLGGTHFDATGRGCSMGMHHLILYLALYFKCDYQSQVGHFCKNIDVPIRALPENPMVDIYVVVFSHDRVLPVRVCSARQLWGPTAPSGSPSVPLAKNGHGGNNS